MISTIDNFVYFKILIILYYNILFFPNNQHIKSPQLPLIKLIGLMDLYGLELIRTLGFWASEFLSLLALKDFIKNIIIKLKGF